MKIATCLWTLKSSTKTAFMMFARAREMPANVSVRFLHHMLQNVPAREQHWNGVTRFRNAVSLSIQFYFAELTLILSNSCQVSYRPSFSTMRRGLLKNLLRPPGRNAMQAAMHRGMSLPNGASSGRKQRVCHNRNV